VKEYLGGINDFLRQRKIENLKEIERKAAPATPATAPAPHTPKKEPAKNYEEKKAQDRQRRKQQSEIANVEARIQQHEQTIAAMDAQLARPDAQPLNDDFFQRYEREKRALEQALYEWEILCDES
jgi:ATP-binding cassette subfamily F protein 3